MNQIVPVAEGFADRVARLLTRVEYRKAVTSQELEDIFRLRYNANLRERAIEPNPTGRLVDRFDETPNVHNFGIFIDGALTSALRLHVLSQHEPYSPALEAFPDLLRDKVDAGLTIIDGNRFVADYPRARSFPQLPYITLRVGMLAAAHYNAHLITASVRSEHYPFYQREYMAAKLCEPRPYPTLVKPLSLIVIDHARNSDAIISRHPFYESTESEREALFRVMEPTF